MVPFFQSFSISVSTSGVSLEPFCKHGAVLLVRDDLAGDRAVPGRACLLLGRDDRRVHDERVALADLHRDERGGGRLVDERCLRRVQLLLDPGEAGRVGLRAGLQSLQIGERMRHRRLLRQQHALVRVEVRRREVDRLLPLRGDRGFLERDVERLVARREELLPRSEDVLRCRAEILRDRRREIDLEALRVEVVRAAHLAVGKVDRGVAETDDERPGGHHRGMRRPARDRCDGESQHRDRGEGNETLHRVLLLLFGSMEIELYAREPICHPALERGEQRLGVQQQAPLLEQPGAMPRCTDSTSALSSRPTWSSNAKNSSSQPGSTPGAKK